MQRSVVHDPATCVFVGDRPYDDVHGAQGAGMRTVLVPNSDVPAFDAAVPGRRHHEPGRAHAPH